MSKLLGMIKESFYFSIAVSYLTVVWVVDSVIKFVRRQPPYPQGLDSYG